VKRLALACLIVGFVSSCSPRADLAPLITDVPGATAYRYGTRDDRGGTMDTLKVIQDGPSSYIGVYHTLVGGVFLTRVATSTDLLNWTFRADLGMHDSQPTIRAFGGSYVVASESDTNGSSAPRTWVRFRRYDSRSALLAGTAARTFDAPHTLVGPTGAEGTPNIYGGDLDHLDVGFHYFRDGVVDRQARGTLTNFSSWTTRTEPQIDRAIEARGVAGNIGDRDDVAFRGSPFTIHEGQLRRGDFSSWRAYLYDPADQTADLLDIHTHKGSTAFANASFTVLTDPSGKAALFVAIFVPTSGSARGEGGELTYYRRL
jgi:hypothetical protein